MQALFGEPAMAQYVEKHAIAARLTAAVNTTISTKPDDPYQAMVRRTQPYWSLRMAPG